LTRLSGDEFTSEAGFIGMSAQWWTSDRLTLEGGMGVGYLQTGERKGKRGWFSEDGLWQNTEEFKAGFAMQLGAGFSLFQGESHSLRAGLEYTPIFTEHSHHIFGVVLGYQHF
jgi:hypothetical protein